jgi:hypothetical protein
MVKNTIGVHIYEANISKFGNKFKYFNFPVFEI